MDETPDEGRRGERRTRMLEGAARVFSRHAFEQASMDDIAHEAGVGKPTLYRYFPSKDALFAEVFVQALDRLEARFEEVLAREGTVAARLGGLVGAMVPTFRDHLVALRFVGDTPAEADQSRRRIFRDRRVRIAGLIARAFGDALAAGEIRPVDATRTAQLVIGMVWSAAASLPGSDDELAGDIADLVLRGVVLPHAAPDGARRSRNGKRGPARGLHDGAGPNLRGRREANTL